MYTNRKYRFSIPSLLQFILTCMHVSKLKWKMWHCRCIVSVSTKYSHCSRVRCKIDRWLRIDCLEVVWLRQLDLKILPYRSPRVGGTIRNYVEKSYKKRIGTSISYRILIHRTFYHKMLLIWFFPFDNNWLHLSKVRNRSL
jgi:hypothetical protein